MRLKFVLTLILISLGVNLYSQMMNIRVFSEKKLDNIELIPSFGIYSLELDNNKISIRNSVKIKVSNQGSGIKVSISDSNYGSFNTVKLSKESLKSFFQINPLDKTQPRRYDDNLIINVRDNNLLLINNIEVENYIAGVVQAETWGATKNVEFFKVQAICVRNYLMKNKDKHKKDGYNLCDQVHCQAYKGRANQAEVIQGAYNSKGEIIVDEKGDIIETLFHSNSGGETVNSQDVWGRAFSHLLGKIDTFSVGGKAYTWEKFIQFKDWQRYFRDKGINVRDDSIKNELLNFSQEDGRKKEMLGISLVQIRKDFNLRSTFFSCEPWGSEVKLNGKGYGHGVGMSQEGAIGMCDQGYEYWQVIEFYFTGAKIKRIEGEKMVF